MSFRRVGGLNYSSKHNYVSSSNNATGNLLISENVGLLNTCIHFESNIDASFCGPTGSSGSGVTGPTGPTGGLDLLSASTYGDYIYWNGSTWAVGSQNINLGANAGQGTQGTQAVAIGANAGQGTQGNYAVAIGANAGKTGQSDQAVAIGYLAGQGAQGPQSVAIGYQAGFNGQGGLAVAIGYQAGNNVQGNNGIAMGYQAGFNSQGPQAVAIGYLAAYTGQGSNAVAIGEYAGQNTQGNYAIAIGCNAGQNAQHANSIVINASGSATNTTGAGCFINPIRGSAGAGIVLYYNTGTHELTYNTSSASTKNTIRDLTVDTDVLYDLKPKTYIYNSDPGGGEQIGYIAEEVRELNKHFATYNEPGGDPVAINYNTIIVFLVEEMKKLTARVAALETRVGKI